MMNNDVMTNLYQTEHFQAVGLSLVDSGTMYFFLPKEGYKAQDIAVDPQIIKICMEPVSMESNSALVHLTVPKFNDSFMIFIKIRLVFITNRNFLYLFNLSVINFIYSK